MTLVRVLRLLPELSQSELQFVSVRARELASELMASSNGSSVSIALPLSSTTKKYEKEATEVLNFLNEKAGKTFRAQEVNLRFIAARLASGATVEDCRGIVARMCREWGTDPKMRRYLRPATLFNATNFEQYIGEKRA